VKVTARAVELFRQMEALPPCCCVWGPHYYDVTECVSCRRWWGLHNELYHELKLVPSEYPVVTHPPDKPPHAELMDSRTVSRSMPHTASPGHWPGAQELFEELAAIGRYWG
jgi:hypothetical protein